MPTVPKTSTDPHQLRAIIDLRRAGWNRQEITVVLNISQRTYYNRLAEINARRVAASPLHVYSPA